MTISVSDLNPQLGEPVSYTPTTIGVPAPQLGPIIATIDPVTGEATIGHSNDIPPIVTFETLANSGGGNTNNNQPPANWWDEITNWFEDHWTPQTGAGTAGVPPATTQQPATTTQTHQLINGVDNKVILIGAAVAALFLFSGGGRR